MTKRTHIVTLAAVFALTSVSAIVAAQQRPNRVSDQQVGALLSRMDAGIARFRASFNQAIDRSQRNGSRAEDDIDQSMNDFTQATDRLRDRAQNRRAGATDVEDVLRRASVIDGFMTTNALDGAVERDWQSLRRELDALARAYNVAWNWSNPRYTADERRRGLSHRLTGTYQLESGRGDDPSQAAEQATRTLPSNQRKRAYQRLINRLNTPETLAIDRDENSVTMASSLGQRVTFEADGRIHTERGEAGRTVSTRATLNGDQLVVTTTGSRGNDFGVTFEPIDDGRTLRVTRRITDDNLRQPVTVQSFYRKSSAEAQWNIYATNRRAPTQTESVAGDFGMPNGTWLVATLDNALSTRNAHAEDRFTITTRSPSQYDGAVIEGTVSSVNTSGRVSGRAEMALNFESIRLRNGRTYPFAGVIEQVRRADGELIRVDNEGTVEQDSQTEKTVQRGAIGAALGAIIGAISGGGDGAAIGAAIGAGVGAGTVVVQGRDQLDLPRGTELTITSRGQRTSTSRQR
jgi:YMGG-like Gly-zipper